MTEKKKIPEYITFVVAFDGSNNKVNLPTSEMNKLSLESFFPPEKYDHDA